MPIEIRELVIRTVVGGEVPAPTSSGRSGANSGDGGPGLSQDTIDTLVQECVRQVLLALARERDR